MQISVICKILVYLGTLWRFILFLGYSKLRGMFLSLIIKVLVLYKKKHLRINISALEKYHPYYDATGFTTVSSLLSGVKTVSSVHERIISNNSANSFLDILSLILYNLFASLIINTPLYTVP